MSTEDNKTLKQVLKAQKRLLMHARTLNIAVCYTEDGKEVIEQGQAPFVRHHDDLYIYSSHLSGHIRGLLSSGLAQFLLIEDESLSQNIWARVRIKFAAEIAEISRDEEVFSTACDLIGEAHGPVMEMIRNFTDFHLFKITPTNGVLVTGFAAAYKVEGPHFEVTAHLRSS